MQAAMTTNMHSVRTIISTIGAAAVMLAFPLGMAMLIKFGMASPSLF